MAKVHSLFTEILRPKSIKQIILLDRIRKIIKDGELDQNYLFTGRPGVGKCVTGDTIVNVFNKKTNTYSSVEIKSLLENPFQIQ